MFGPILNTLERGLQMFQQILALLVRIDAALTAIKGKLDNLPPQQDPDAIPGAQAAQLRGALAALAQRAEAMAGDGAAPLRLSLSVPSNIVGGNQSTGSVGISAPQSADTVVSLSSSHAGLLGVPSSVVIPAGQTSVAFSITAATAEADTTVTVEAKVGEDVTRATISVMHQ